MIISIFVFSVTVNYVMSNLNCLGSFLNVSNINVNRIIIDCFNSAKIVINNIVQGRQYYVINVVELFIYFIK